MILFLNRQVWVNNVGQWSGSTVEQIRWVFGDNWRIISEFSTKKTQQHMFIWRNNKNYPYIVLKYPPYLFHWVYTVCHSVCSFRTYFSIVKPQLFKYKDNYSIFSGVWIFQIFTVITSRSTTRAQVLIKLSARRERTGELARVLSRKVRPDPQQLWSSSAPQSNTQWISLSSSCASCTASVKL